MKVMDFEIDSKPTEFVDKAINSQVSNAVMALLFRKVNGAIVGTFLEIAGKVRQRWSDACSRSETDAGL